MILSHRQKLPHRQLFPHSTHTIGFGKPRSQVQFMHGHKAPQSLQIIGNCGPAVAVSTGAVMMISISAITTSIRILIFLPVIVCAAYGCGAFFYTPCFMVGCGRVFNGPAGDGVLYGRLRPGI